MYVSTMKNPVSASRWNLSGGPAQEGACKVGLPSTRQLHGQPGHPHSVTRLVLICPLGNNI